MLATLVAGSSFHRAEGGELTSFEEVVDHHEIREWASVWKDEPRVVASERRAFNELGLRANLSGAAAVAVASRPLVARIDSLRAENAGTPNIAISIPSFDLATRKEKEERTEETRRQ